MIRNNLERAHAEKQLAGLKQAYEGCRRSDSSENLSSLAIAAYQSQMGDLAEQIKYYDDLVSGIISPPEVTHSILNMPLAITAQRIAKRISLEQLSQLTGINEATLDRYERNDYFGVALDQMIKISSKVGLVFDGFAADLSEKAIKERFKLSGLDFNFLQRRLVPERLRTQGEDPAKALSFLVDSALSIYGWTKSALVTGGALTLRNLGAVTRFKKQIREHDPKNAAAYIEFSHYMALLLLENCACVRKQVKLQLDPEQVRLEILETTGEIDFNGILTYVWSKGIPVLPLPDPGIYHGACWRHDGKNVIVLKQRLKSPSRWSFDLLHELYHAAENPTVSEFEQISFDSQEAREEEDAANFFAAEVLTDGRTDELYESCIFAAQNSIPLLKEVVVRTADEERLPVGILANLMAWRLAKEGQNWWGTASNLQESSPDPFEISHRILLDNLSYEPSIREQTETILRAVGGHS